MAYDPELADRVRRALAGRAGVAEKPLFGTLAFTVDGSLAVAAARDGLMVRIGEAAMPAALAQPHVRESAMGARTMKGWVLVAPPADLDEWIERGVAHARGLSEPS
jgi:hypothetical protein